MIHPIDFDVDIAETRPRLCRFARWWRMWRNVDRCPARKVEAALNDGANELKSTILVGKWPVSADLLGRRMEHLRRCAIDMVLAEPCHAGTADALPEQSVCSRARRLSDDRDPMVRS